MGRLTYLHAISDPFWCLDVLEGAPSAVNLSGGSRLYVLGDYVPHLER